MAPAAAPPPSINLPRFKNLVRLYGLRAESPRGACAEPLQAAADTFNNPRAAHEHAAFFEIRPRTTTPRTRAVNVTRQVEARKAK